VLSDSFSAVPRAMVQFCALGLIFGGTEGAGSNFNVLLSRTHFRRYRGHQVQFSYFALSKPILDGTECAGSDLCFALPNSCSSEPRALSQVFMLWALGSV
jgi:hypothetical protein